MVWEPFLKIRGRCNVIGWPRKCLSPRSPTGREGPSFVFYCPAWSRSKFTGGWGNNPYCLRAAYRHGNPPDIGLDMVGFRCAGEAE